MKTIILPANTQLHHGTDSKRRFKMPKGPAWFCEQWDAAAPWAGWRKTGPGIGGVRRVLSLYTTAEITLLDTVSFEDWNAMGLELLDDPEPGTYEAALAVAKAGYAGWYGKTEIMLVETKLLVHVETKRVPVAVKSHGDV